MSSKKFKVQRQECSEFQRGLKHNLGCLICGTYDNLSWHHVDPKKKQYTVANMSKMEMMIKEIYKCVVLCGNCHWRMHNKKEQQ